MTESFTLVFKGDLRRLMERGEHPLGTESPWGEPYSAANGDLIRHHDVMRSALNRIMAANELHFSAVVLMKEIARKALDEVQS